MSKNFIPYHTCGRMTHLNLIDAKDNGTGNFEIFECRDCYGPGWMPLNMDDLDPDSAVQREVHEFVRATRDE